MQSNINEQEYEEWMRYFKEWSEIYYPRVTSELSKKMVQLIDDGGRDIRKQIRKELWGEEYSE